MPSNQYSTRFDAAVMMWGRIYLVLVLLLCAAAMYTLAVSLWRGPWRDMWEVMPFIEKAIKGQADWQDYWEQYGFSHRPLVSRWLWIVDLRWFSASNALLLAVSLLMQLVIFLAVRSVLLHDMTFTTQQRNMVLASVVFCLLNATQVFNFLHTFDVQWFLVTGFVTVSLVITVLYASRERSLFLAVAWFLVMIASLNNFSAILMWPVLFFLMIALRIPVRNIVFFVIATIAYFFLYFHHLVPQGEAGIGAVIRQLSVPQQLQLLVDILVVFPLWYLANPLSFQLAGDGPFHLSLPFSWLAPSLVGVLLMTMVWQWYLALFHRKKCSAVALLGLSLMLYGYGVGIATAMGRGFFWENVYALRYQNIVLLFWIGVVLWLSAGIRWRSAGLLAGSLLLLLVFASRVGWYHDLMLKTGNRTRDAHLALVVGLENQLSAIQATVSRSHLGNDSIYTLEYEAQFLREHHAGPFAEPQWNNLPVRESLQSSPACATNASDSDIHGDDDSYARLSISFAEPVNYSVIVWFDIDSNAPGLLIATRADTWWPRLQQSFNGFTEYAGFAKRLPQRKTDNVFARDGDQWCRLML